LLSKRLELGFEPLLLLFEPCQLDSIWFVHFRDRCLVVLRCPARPVGANYAKAS
jgi:hypothetical protein